MLPLGAITAFREVTLKHPHLDKALRRLSLAVRQADQGNMIFLFGPTGVGKTTLASHIREKLDKEYRASGEYDKSTLPVVLIEAPRPDVGQRFGWKEFYRRALAVLHDPLAHKKVNDPRCSAFFSQPRIDNRAPGHELRLAFENALHYRKTRLLVIDEAQHIAGGTSASGLHDQLDYIKSLANLTGTVIVLVGTYELLAFRNLSAQLSRRSIDVHFPRYHSDEPDEYQKFANVVASFSSKLPVPCNFMLVDKLDDLYVGSLGCVGMLSGWLIKAMKRAVEESDGTMRYQDLTESMYSYAQMNKMIEELQEGESLLAPPKDSMSSLKARLGLAATTVKESGRKPSAVRQKRKPFVRKPVRDAVGSPK